MRTADGGGPAGGHDCPGRAGVLGPATSVNGPGQKRAARRIARPPASSANYLAGLERAWATWDNDRIIGRPALWPRKTLATAWGGPGRWLPGRKQSRFGKPLTQPAPAPARFPRPGRSPSGWGKSARTSDDFGPSKSALIPPLLCFSARLPIASKGPWSVRMKICPWATAGEGRSIRSFSTFLATSLELLAPALRTNILAFRRPGNKGWPPTRTGEALWCRPRRSFPLQFCPVAASPAVSDGPLSFHHIEILVVGDRGWNVSPSPACLRQKYVACW